MPNTILLVLTMMNFGWVPQGFSVDAPRWPHDTRWTWLDSSGALRHRADLDSSIMRHSRWIEMLSSAFNDRGGRNYVISLLPRATGFSGSGSSSGDMDGGLIMGLLTKRLPTGSFVLDRAQMPFLSLDHDTLIGAAITQSNLRYAQAGYCDFSAAALCSDSIDSSLFFDSRLTKTSFWGSSVKNAGFTRCNMQFSHFGNAQLDCAQFWLSDLSFAVFDSADLTNARFDGTDLSNASFNSANLNSVSFEPTKLPEPVDIAYAKNIDKMRFDRNPGPLTMLKDSFIDKGFKKQAKQVNAAIRRTQRNPLHYLMFDLTCAYGSSPFRPLLIILVLIPFWAILYLFRVGVSSDSCGPRFYGENIFGRNGFSNLSGDRIISCFWLSIYSSLRLGYRGFNPISMLLLFLPEEYEIHSEGEPRILSAIQSVISFYLFILFVWTILGAPFDVKTGVL
jgi:uncharacterized protein YjbI with pentapeptide repeats